MGDPVNPVAPIKPPAKNVEQVLAEQANDAMAHGADPHSATAMLGTMVRHLRANPEIAQHATDAIAQGADPHAVSSQIYQMASAPAKATPGQQFGTLLANGATLGFAPKVLGAIDAAGKMLPRALGGESAPASSFGANYTAMRDRVRAAAAQGMEEHPVAGRVTELAGGALASLPALAERAAVGGANMLEQTLARKIAERTATGAGIGAVAGAGNSVGGVKDYAKGIGAGAVTGAVVGNVLPPVMELGGSALGKTATALWLRPSGRSAEEMAADAAAMRAPVGPQAGASNTPAADAIQNGPVIRTGSDARSVELQLPTLGQQVRAATGRVVANTGVETSKTRALREVARRLDFDNVTPADATAFAERNASKPVAVLDLGQGNVGGLARSAKDTPSLARRQIPEFLNGRSAGTFGDEGQTLQRVTGDIEQRIGLKPENYYKNVDDMVSEQKALSKPDYDKVRNLPVDDGEVLSLFDIPEFRFAHEAVARAERIRPNGTPIKPLSEVTDQSGSVMRVQNPQTLGTLDKMRQYIGDVARGKLESKAIDRHTAGAMLERLDAATQRLDELHPDYAKARAGYAGRAQMMDAYQAGKDEFMTLDPRAIQQKLATLPESQADLYRRGGYDALRASKLTKMDDGANIGAFLEKNPDIRDRVAALSKNPDDALALRGDFNAERAMGDRKNFILGGPNTAERLIDHESTKPLVTHAGDLLRHIPGIGKAVGGLVDNTLTRRTAEQTGDVMGEVGKIMTRTGPAGIRQTFDEVARLKAEDAARKALRERLAAGIAGPASTVNARRR